MEFRKPRWDEKVDWDLVARHDREISPLLHRRALFAGVENFLLYDFFTPEGYVDENVFAFSNGIEDRRAFVIYQNRFASTRGWIRTSSAFAAKREGGASPGLVQRTLGEGLALTPEEGRFILFRELSTGLEYIRPSRDLCEQGFYAELNAYQCRVFLDVREVRDGEDRGYARLAEELGGRGVPSLENALREVRFRRAHAAFRDLASPEALRRILAARVAPAQEAPDPAIPEAIEGKLLALFSVVRQGAGGKGDEATIAQEMRRLMETILRLPAIQGWLPGSPSQETRSAVREILSGLESQPSRWGLLLGWVLAEGIERMRTGGEARAPARPESRSGAWRRSWGRPCAVSDGTRRARTGTWPPSDSW